MKVIDYILRQMNSLGRALGKFFSNLLKNNNDINLDVIKTTNEILIDELRIDITSLFLVKDEDIIELFVGKNKLG